MHQKCKDCHGDLLACDKERYSGASIFYVLGASSPLTQSEAPQRRRGGKGGGDLPPQLTRVWGSVVSFLRTKKRI